MGWRILIVDDDPDIRVLLDALLTDPDSVQSSPNRIRVDRASDVDTALAMARRVRYDLAIVDYMMPDKTGIEFVQATRTRCIGLTAYDSIEHVDSFHRAGALAVMAKPFRIDELLDLIDTHLGRSTTQQGEP